MLIEPNTTIKLLSNCPLDTTYDHTIYFASKTAQENYFNSLVKYEFNRLTYQRLNRGTIKLEIIADNIYDCNYLMFKNSAYGNKWFYAFIKSVEYDNDRTSIITYEIDVMQTWMFDYTLGECFVEREHSETDNVGDNLIPEKLELGDYVSDDVTTTEILGETSIVAAASFDDEFSYSAGTYYSGIYSGLHYFSFDNSIGGATVCAKFLQTVNAIGKTDGIVSLFLMPKAMLPADNSPAPPRQYTITKNKPLSDIGGYTPKNKKLFTYPYNFLYVTNLQGNSAEFKYEYFATPNCTFNLAGDFSANPSVVLSPTYYKNVTINYDEKLVLAGFPQLSWSSDTYRAWLAQNSSSMVLQTIGSAVSGLTSPYSIGNGTAYGAISGLVGGVFSALAENERMSKMPPQAHVGSGSTTMASLGILDFYFMHKHIRPEFAKIIDDYFTMFGYACHRVKVPNISSRPHWNYTKTKGCLIVGSIPCDDANKICKIFDNGITFWKNGNEIGNYNLDNSPN